MKDFMKNPDHDQPNQQPSQSRRRGIYILIGVIPLLVCLILSPLWIGPALRAVLPDRYLADERVPEFVRNLVFDYEADQTLPTVIPGTIDASVLLETESPIGEPASTPTQRPDTGEAISTSSTPEAISTSQVSTPTETVPLPLSFTLNGFTHTYQGWNNCGPATLTTTLSYWNLGVTQAEAANFLKPNPEDRNVRPDELAAYVESIGYEAIVRVDGDLLLLKRLISAGYPVIVEKGFDPEPDRLGWMGHYLVFTGYSDQDQLFTAMDSYLGPDQQEPYAEFDTMWRHFNRTYMVVFPSEDRDIITGLIGEEMNDTVMYNNAIRTAQAELEENREDAFGWFNLGSSLGAQQRYEEAAIAFDEARRIGVPWRMLWYQYGPYEAYLAVGRYEDVLTLADVILADNEYSEEAHYWKGRVYMEREQVDTARAQFRAALRQNAHYEAAQQALDNLGD